VEETSGSTLVLNPHSAGAFEFARANKMDATWPLRIARLSSPIMALKQWINVLQLVKASKWLAEGDIQARKDAGLLKRKPR
jgi:CDP-diacylglycerol--inositol 3-phosphatidyltransferase